MANAKVLWIDDEIDNLKPQIMFLEKKGYDVVKATNGHDGLELCQSEPIDVVLLDESMPGMTGLETLSKIKEVNASLPVVMITKNEAENIMEEAIGAQITDYLLKPVNPRQILLTLKKIIDSKTLVSNATNSAYQQDFRKISMDIQMGPDYEGWVDIYKKIVHWELEFDNANTQEMQQVLAMQKSEANKEFCRYVSRNYMKWIQNRDEGPTMSHTLMRDKILPRFERGKPNFMILIDNLRFDQWKVLKPIISEEFRFLDEDYFYSILPTTTHYSRNAIFAGMTPYNIERRFPRLWKNDIDEGGKNLHEADFLEDLLDRTGREDLKFSYTKITNHRAGKELMENIHNLLDNDLNVIVYNFVDMLSHARTEMEVLKELASDEAAYRSIAKSWFSYSPLWEALKKISDHDINIAITTDHGTIRVNTPKKVIGDRNTTTNLRYKHGRNLQYNSKEVYEVRNPIEAQLPRPHVSSSFIFAKEDSFFVYPNNYNHYVNYYNNTFQHGGMSIQEMIVPVAWFGSK
ncbi:MAG: response regulator [Chitinophagales bacterium]